MSFHRFTSRALAVGLVAGAMAITAAPAQAANVAEGFDDITTLTDWQRVNLSQPTGSNAWFQGNPTVFPAQAGAATNSYIAANFNSTAGTGTISNWLISPKQTSLSSADVLDFWTQSASGDPVYPDRLEVRVSTNGSCSPGTTATGVGDFTTLVTSINPDLTVSGYPFDWTRFTLPLSSIAGPASGCFAFRYYVTSGGPSGDNSNYIGIDSVTFSDKTAPAVTVTSGPAGATSNATPTFAFASNEASTFQCRVTPAGSAAPAFGACSGPGNVHTPAGLADGSYTFEVRGTDGGANSTVATRTFQVVAAACATAQSSVASAQATLTTAQATLKTAQTKLKKAVKALKKAKKALKAADTAAEVKKAKAKVAKAKKAVKKAKKRVATAKTGVASAQAALTAAQAAAAGTCV